MANPGLNLASPMVPPVCQESPQSATSCDPKSKAKERVSYVRPPGSHPATTWGSRSPEARDNFSLLPACCPPGASPGLIQLPVLGPWHHRWPDRPPTVMGRAGSSLLGDVVPSSPREQEPGAEREEAGKRLQVSTPRAPQGAPLTARNEFTAQSGITPAHHPKTK